MKTIKDFKAAMTIDSQWGCIYTRKEIKSPNSQNFERVCVESLDRGTRVCTYLSARGFELAGSFCHWPNKATFKANGDTITIEDDWTILVYTLIM